MDQNFNNLYEQETILSPTEETNNQKKRKRRKVPTGVKVTAIALAAALVGGLGGGAIMASVIDSNAPASSQTLSASGEDMQTGTGSSDAQQPSAGDSSLVLQVNNSSTKDMTPSEVYADNVSSVVAISTQTTVNVFGQISATASSGSGFIISEDGYIVTNYHVIEDADSITVMLHDSSEYEATVVGYDEDNDVALLKIEATGLNPVSLGDSDALIIGEQVCAIGNPLGELTFTLTCGYVSALDREINIDGTPIRMFQTDAAINPGNSGGPLFDMAGNVIGITTAKYADDDVEGLGFVIPINDVVSIVNDLIQYGRVVGRPYLGVTVQDATGASMYNLPEGAYVISVEEGSCAAEAGIQAGDIITGIGDETIESYTELVTALRDYRAGDTVTITVFQSGSYHELSVTLDEQPEQTEEDTSTQTDGNYYTFPYGWYGNAG